jgi:hypothetical protein
MLVGKIMADGPPSPEIIALVGSFSGIGGIAYHLWFGRPITTRQWIGATLLSGFCGVLTYLWLFEDVDSQLKLIVVSLLAGIGGTSLLDLAVLQIASKMRKMFNGD